MSIRLKPARSEDAAELAALRTEVALDMTARFGHGHWSHEATEKGVLSSLRKRGVFIARDRSRIVATLCLSTKKPWAIDTSYFTGCERALYLTSMAIVPDLQCRGLGRSCLEQVRQIAADWPSDAIRLDAYDSPAGAGDFYAKCGYREVGRVVYRGTPLTYYELLLTGH